jgi:hypothetical protein
MLNRDDELPILLEASPAFADVWGDPVLGRNARKQKGPGLLHSFAVHTVHLIALRQLQHLPPIFEAIERLLVEGDRRVNTDVALYFLEWLWIGLKQKSIRPVMVLPWLGPESTRELNILRRLLPAMCD